jgi:two-component system chemotaxis response regulator CheB
MAVEKNTVYIAPGGKQMRVFTDASGSGQALSVTDDPPEDGCRPSVNQLFRSGARVWGGSVVAVVLTGMGSDGTKGLLDLKQAGAYVIAQDKSTSVVWGMPGSAVASGCVDKVLPIDQIAAEVAAVARGL